MESSTHGTLLKCKKIKKKKKSQSGIQLTKNWHKMRENLKKGKKKSNPRKPLNLELLKNLDDQKLTSGPDGALVNST